MSECPQTYEFCGGAEGKFGFMAVPAMDRFIGFEQPLKIADGFWFLPKAPAQLDDAWRKFLGEAAEEGLVRAPFWVFTTKEAPLAGSQGQDDPLAATLHHLFFCLLMGGFPKLGVMYPAQSYVGTGFLLDGRFAISTCRFGTPYLPIPTSEGLVTSPDSLRRAVRRLPLYYGVCSGPGTPWLRVCRGLHMLFKAMQENYPEFRMHHYVQSLEALLAFCKRDDEPKRRDNREQFKHRCRPFTVDSQNRGTILGQFYDMRGKVEHMHLWTSCLTGKPDGLDSIAMLRLWQVEKLALHVYSRLLESEVLLDCFRDDRIATTWRAEPCELDSLWTDKLDLETFVWRKSDGEAMLSARGYDPMQIMLDDLKSRWPAAGGPEFEPGATRQRAGGLDG